ncbi:MAG TPA: hypothetical protein VGP95_11720 [Gemmatimonadaceae bacterium]|nr:hypothetical protein [Gemmatimonadaceae bacterium]
MNDMHYQLRRVAFSLAIAATIGAANAAAQDADPLPVNKDTLYRFPNTIAGEFTPGTGFNIISTKFGSLNISTYGLFRYLNQMPAGQTFTDHLGQVRKSNLQNSLNWQRTMIWLTGFFYDPRFRYNITGWSLGATQQTLIFGNVQFIASRNFVIGVGIVPTLTARSMQGSWPFWAGSDRLMVEEFFRGGFSSGAFVTGEIAPRLFYTLSVNNNLSQLGQVQANDSRDLAYSASVRWQPTTGEFGPRGGFGDLEYHTRVATQFGFSTGHSREFRGTPIDQAPVASQIKLSDGVNPFDFSALAAGVTATNLSYHELAIDAGAKYRGFAFQGEYYLRTLNDFVADGPLPLTNIFDRGFMAEMGYMVVPRRLNLDVFGGYVWDQFRRFPWELGGGLNLYPSGTRSWRLNVHVMHVDKSPSSSFFGYYLAGQTGTTFSIGTDVLF